MCKIYDIIQFYYKFDFIASLIPSVERDNQNQSQRMTPAVTRHAAVSMQHRTWMIGDGYPSSGPVGVFG